MRGPVTCFRCGQEGYLARAMPLGALGSRETNCPQHQGSGARGRWTVAVNSQYPILLQLNVYDMPLQLMVVLAFQ